MRLVALKADITTLEVDAIVNAANTTLLGGAGVDGAIHRAAGKALLQKCSELGGCATGQAKLTPGYNLPAKFIIHTVGPVWSGGARGEPDLLASAYCSSLEIAHENQIKTLAFPCISTGAYRFPSDLAAEIAIDTTTKFLETNFFPEKIIYCCFSEADLSLYQKLLAERKVAV